jgi:hypothetical protein
MRIISYVGYFDTFSPYLFVDEINILLGIMIHISCCFITPTYVDVRKGYLSQQSI